MVWRSISYETRRTNDCDSGDIRTHRVGSRISPVSRLLSVLTSQTRDPCLAMVYLYLSQQSDHGCQTVYTFTGGSQRTVRNVLNYVRFCKVLTPEAYQHQAPFPHTVPHGVLQPAVSTKASVVGSWT